MPQLYGKPLNRKQLKKYIGAEWQAGGVRRMRFVDGPEDGTEVLQFETGTGLYFNVIPSRGLDIASTKFCGASISFDIPGGEAHPAHFDPRGIQWIKTFFGGLLTTCGMTWAGAPNTDQGEELGLHGRFSHITARNLKIGDEWQGNTRRLWVSGEIRESMLFGPNIVCRRTISTEVGTNTIRIQDKVSNEGFTKQPHQYLYHINIGHPVMDENTELLINSKVTPRDEVAEEGIQTFNRFEKPVAGYKENVYYHDIKPDRKGMAHAALVNTKFNNGQGLGVHVAFRKKEFHRFTQWKHTGMGEYVCGLEPCNCSVEGRAKDRGDGSLLHLKPGEEKEYITEINILPDNKAIQAVKKLIK